MLTDRGSCFTADGFEAACRKLGVTHRKTRPYTPRTNGMVERFNGRIQREVLGITVASHRDLETLLQGFNQAYNARRQRVLKGRSPDMLVRERLSAAPPAPTAVTTHRSIRAFCPRLFKSLLVPRTSRIQTAKLTLGSGPCRGNEQLLRILGGTKGIKPIR